MPDTAAARLDSALLDELSSIVSAAAAAILAARNGPLEVRQKPDASPVTAADHAAEAVLLDGVRRVLPDLAIVSEEAVSSRPAQLPRSFVLLDPLDGTREFIAGRDEFTVNLAVMHDAQPHLGIVAAPAQQIVWRGIVGQGAERLLLAPGARASAARERKAIRTRGLPRSGLVAAVSRSHLDSRTEDFLAGLPVVGRITCGSALKFGQLAEGLADVYPRFSPTCEWDIAAGHALLAAAGGILATPEGGRVLYGRMAAAFCIPAFVAWGDPSAPAALRLQQRRQRAAEG
jgi:3'(2'), 5'-bisphosphate nucleotidase